MARSTPPDLHLVTLKGDSDPTDLKLDPARVISIGRTGNVRVHDSLVSIHHAKLYYDLEERSFVVEDLGSANGTFINGECVRGESRLVRSGTELRIGDTVFEVQSPTRGLSWLRLRPMLLAGLLVVLVFVLIRFLIKILVQGPPPDLPLPTPEPVTIPVRGTVQEIPVDYGFLWDNGIGWPLEVNQVTRIKELASDVVWIGDWGRQRAVVVTFDDAERWHLLGDLPGDGHISESLDTVYPVYTDSDGLLWNFDPGRHRYRLTAGTAATGQKTVSLVVWYRKQPPKPTEEGEAFHAPPPPEPLQVGRLSLKGEREQLSLFLSERSVQEAVHYIVCEGAFPGIRPQVLTYEGTQQELAPACLRSLRIEGTDDPVDPVAIALDEDGRQALIDDVTRFYSGDAHGLFLPDEFAEAVEAVRADPGVFKPVVKVVVQSAFALAPPYDPFPGALADLPAATRDLLPDQKNPLAPQAAPRVQVQRMPYPGRMGDLVTEIPTKGCEKLRVVTHGQYQPPALTFSPPFAEVSSVGCGADHPLLAVPYSGGVFVETDPNETDVAVRVEMDGKRVRTAEIGWRP